ncbi:hypothetical protein ACFY6U_12815 [Streptomyces sp. NPDC013157]|uniref:hypothetical protein n=1 Tax=Streptomyces sp. NPDC013157 TaxID=3364861 RepID=UPI0036BDC28F
MKPPDPAKVAAAIRAQSGTGSYFGTAKTQVSVAGVKGGTPLVVYRGDAADSGQRMLSGRWFSAPGEAVAPARFLQATGAKIGDTVDEKDALAGFQLIKDKARALVASLPTQNEYFRRMRDGA